MGWNWVKKLHARAGKMAQHETNDDGGEGVGGNKLRKNDLSSNRNARTQLSNALGWKKNASFFSFRVGGGGGGGAAAAAAAALAAAAAAARVSFVFFVFRFRVSYLHVSSRYLHKRG